MVSPSIRFDAKKDLTGFVNNAIFDIAKFRDLEAIVNTYPQQSATMGILEKFNPFTFFKNSIKTKGYENFYADVTKAARAAFQQQYNQDITDLDISEGMLDVIVKREIDRNIQQANENELSELAKKAMDQIKNGVFWDGVTATEKMLIEGMVDPTRKNLALAIHNANQNRIQYRQELEKDESDENLLNTLNQEYGNIQVSLDLAHKVYQDEYEHDNMLIDLETGMRITEMPEDKSNVADKTTWYTNFMQEIEETRASGDLSKIRGKFGLFAIQYNEHLLDLKRSVTAGNLKAHLQAKLVVNNPSQFDENWANEEITIKDLLDHARYLNKNKVSVYFDLDENEKLILSDKPTDFHEQLFILDDHDINLKAEKIGWEEVLLLNRDMGKEVNSWYDSEELKTKALLAGEGFLEYIVGDVITSQHDVNQIVSQTTAGAELPKASLKNLEETTGEFFFKTLGTAPIMAAEFMVVGGGIRKIVGGIGKIPKMLKYSNTNLFTPAWLHQSKLATYTIKASGKLANVTRKGQQIIKNGVLVPHAAQTTGAREASKWIKAGGLKKYDKSFNWFRWSSAHAIEAGIAEGTFQIVGMDPFAGTGFHVAGVGMNNMLSKFGIKFNPKFLGLGINRAAKLDSRVSWAIGRQNLLGKLASSGAIMVPGTFLGTTLKGAYDDILDNKAFLTHMEEHYGEWSDKTSPHYVPKKLLQEVMTGIAFGFTHVKKADWVHFVGKTQVVRNKLADKRAAIVGTDKINLEIKKVLSEKEIKEVEKIDSFIRELDAKLIDMNGTLKYIDPVEMKKYLQSKEISKSRDGKPIKYIYQLNNRGISEGSNANVELINGVWTVRVNLNKANTGTIPHEVFHLLTEGVSPEAFNKLFKAILPSLRPSAKGIGEAIEEIYKDQDASTLPAEKITNIIEQLIKDPSRLTEFHKKNAWKTIQEKLYRFFDTNLTKGRDPNGPQYDVKPDINNPKDVLQLLYNIASGLNGYTKGNIKSTEALLKSIRELENLQIDGERLIDIKEKKTVGQRGKTSLSQKEIDMFDVDIKGPTMKEIFGNINSVVDPREWKTLDKVNKENFAFTAGFEALKYIMNKIKMNIPVEKKRDYAMEMIAKDGTINKFIQKWDPEIIPELSRYIFQNGSKLLNFKIVDYLKTTPEYGKQAVGLESVKELTTDVVEVAEGTKPKYQVKILEAIKKKYGEENFDAENNIEKSLDKIMKKITAEKLSYKEVGDLSKNSVVKEIYDFLQITSESKPAEFKELAKSFVYSNKTELWESLPNAYDMNKGISQGVKNNFPSEWYPLTGERFKFSKAPKFMTRAQAASGPKLAIKLKEIPDNFLEWFYGKNVRGNVAKTRLEKLFEHSSRGIGNQTITLRMEKDANYREQLRRDNPDLFRDITYEHIIQELKVAKGHNMAQKDSQRIWEILSDRKTKRDSAKLIAIAEDPTLSKDTKDIMLRILGEGLKEKGELNPEMFKEVKGIAEIVKNNKLILEASSYGSIAKNAKYQEKYKDLQMETLKYVLSKYNLKILDMPSNIRSLFADSMGKSVMRYKIDKYIDAWKIKEESWGDWWGEGLFDGKTNNKIPTHYERAYKPNYIELDAKFVEKGKEINKLNITQAEKNKQLADWYRDQLTGSKNLKNGITYEQVVEANRKVAKEWILGLNKVVQNWKKLGFESKKEAQSLALASMGMHTNIRDGIFKSMVYPFRSITNNPQPGKESSKTTYFEHERQLLNNTNLFINAIIKYGNKPKVFEKVIKEIIETSYQSVTSKRLQELNDASGRTTFSELYAPGGKIKTSTSSMLNIIRNFKEAHEQVVLFGKNKGKTILEVMAENIPPKKLLLELNKMKDKTPALYELRDKVDAELNVKSLNKKIAKKAGIYHQKDISNEDLIRLINTRAEAVRKAADPRAPKKGASILDFDDTVAKSDSKVIVNLPKQIVGGKQYGYETWENGRVKMTSNAKERITPAEFAKNAEGYESIGATFNFSEFSKVIKGKKGPLFEKLENIQSKYGTENTFILTARPKEAAAAIHKFLKGLGINIPIKNIIGLEDGRPGAKANFIVEKAAEGYNEVYFVDDAIKNVKAVKDIVNVLGISGKIREVKEQAQKDLEKEFNVVLEETTGTEAFKKFSAGAAKSRGGDIGKWKWWLPHSAEGFLDLMYPTFGKGKTGNKHMRWFDKNLGRPYAKGFYELNKAKQRIHDDYEALKKKYPNIKKILNKMNDTGFTNDVAIRTYLWNKYNMEIPDLSKTDIKKLVNLVKSNPEMQAFAEQVSKITGLKEGYTKPGDSWLSRSIQHDLIEVSDGIGRQQFFKEWSENVDKIFTPNTMNKLEALFGTRHRKALEDMLYRMKVGHAKIRNLSDAEKQWNKWVGNATGTIMFLNRRSALTQTISMLNFINWSDNNIYAASKAFLNQPQFWKDFVMIWNSPMLKQRRKGLSMDVNYEEITNAVSNKKDKISAATAYLLQKGFVLTKGADNFAIAFGGSTFYRNRLSRYLKEGMNEAEAKEKAFIDFQEASEPTQQSARPDLISQQQASPIGRFALAFQNVSMQNNRNLKRAITDLANKRGDMKTNISKILYYSFVQNVIFLGLQQAAFSAYWDDDATDAHRSDKALRVGNGLLDIWLRGSGLIGVGASTLKNTLLKYIEENEKGFKANEAKVLIEALNVSPPVGSKVRKVYNAMIERKYGGGDLKPILLATEGATNIPFHEFYQMVEEAEAITSDRLEAWQKVAVALGYPEWQVDIKPEPVKIPYVLKKKNKRKITY